MILGIVSDVHGNAEALSMALDEVSSVASRILMAGDAMDEYRFSNDVVELLRDHDVSSIIGNHEAVILGPSGERVRTAPVVRRRNLEYVAKLPATLRIQAGAIRILMVHGNPWHPYNRYLNKNSEEFRHIDELDANVLITGHTHLPMVERLHETLVINPGSLGESREPDHRDTVTCAVLDTVAETVEILRYQNPRFTGAREEDVAERELIEVRL